MTEKKPAEQDKPAEKPAEKSEAKHSKRGDPWSEPCPVCGLLGCRRHA